MSDELDFDLIGIPGTTDATWGIQTGPNVLRTHPESACRNDPNCCVHKPSDHPLKDAPQNWRADRGLMERICPHGIGHPDVDDLAHKRRTLTPAMYDRFAFDVHGCDGCCR